MQAALPVAAGSVLADRYRLDRLLGQGGMGAVYEGHDLRLQRTVAVKVILPHRVTDADAISRFLREARAAAALSHPGITTVHDVGQADTQQGTMPFLVMERLHGESLAERLGRGPLEAGEGASLGASLLEALAVAHGAGVVHRDIKPDNVFLRAPDGRPTLLDFGVARVVRGDGDEATLTREGQSIGTPLYMAPEQLTGARAGPAADLYAVGAMLYEAVTGRPTYRADGYAALVARKVSEEPDLVPLRGAVGPGPFFDTVASALARDPGARPPSAEAMAAMLVGKAPPAVALAQTLSASDGPSRARAAGPAPTPAHTSAAARAGAPSSLRLPLLAAGAGAALLGLAAIALVASGVLTGGDEAPPPPEPVGRSAPALREPTQALGILRQYHDASGEARTLLESPDLWRQCAADLALSVEGRSDAPVRWRSALPFCEGMRALEEARTDVAVEHLEQAVQIEPEWAAPHVPLGHALLAAGQPERAVASVHEAARLEPGWWVPVAALGSIHGRAGRDDEAIQAYRRALAMAPDEPRVLDSLALTYHAAGMDDQAARYAERTLALDPEAPWSHLIQAERQLERGDGHAALESAERTVAVHPRSPAAVLARADALHLLGRDDEARESYERVLELVGEEEATGLPAGRLDAVRSALDAGRLPQARGAERSRSRPRRRSRPSSPATSAPRSHPDELGGLEL